MARRLGGGGAAAVPGALPGGYPLPGDQWPHHRRRAHLRAAPARALHPRCAQRGHHHLQVTQVAGQHTGSPPCGACSRATPPVRSAWASPFAGHAGCWSAHRVTSVRRLLARYTPGALSVGITICRSRRLLVSTQGHLRAAPARALHPRCARHGAAQRGQHRHQQVVQVAGKHTGLPTQSCPRGSGDSQMSPTWMQAGQRLLEADGCSVSTPSRHGAASGQRRDVVPEPTHPPKMHRSPRWRLLRRNTLKVLVRSRRRRDAGVHGAGCALADSREGYQSWPSAHQKGPRQQAANRTV